MQIAVLGIDLGKNICSVVGLDTAGRVVVRRRLRRESVIKFAAGLAPCIIAMEAVLRRPPPRPHPAHPKPRRAPDVAGVCSPLRESVQERRPRC